MDYYKGLYTFHGDDTTEDGLGAAKGIINALLICLLFGLLLLIAWDIAHWSHSTPAVSDKTRMVRMSR